MQTLNFAPLYRATVGYDRIADLMDRVLSAEVASRPIRPTTLKRLRKMPIASRSPSPGSRKMTCRLT